MLRVLFIFLDNIGSHIEKMMDDLLAQLERSILKDKGEKYCLIIVYSLYFQSLCFKELVLCIPGIDHDN